MKIVQTEFPALVMNFSSTYFHKVPANGKCE